MEAATQLFWVVLVLGALAITVRLLSRNRFPLKIRRRKAAAAGGIEMEVLDRVSLTPHHSVHLLRLGTRTYLLSCHPGGSTVLASVEPEAPQ